MWVLGDLLGGDNASPLRSSQQPLAGVWEVSYEMTGTVYFWASFWGSLVHSSWTAEKLNT